MEYKHEGMCPFCNEMVSPKIVEKNTFRRDKCRCTNPSCEEVIYVCRGLGCQDYAKGGVIYDDELCSSCNDGLMERLKKLPEQIEKAAEKSKNRRK